MTHDSTGTRLGAQAAAAVVVVGVAYALVLAVGFIRHGLAEPITDPILAVMELLTIMSALPLLAVFVAVLAHADPGRRVWAVLALCLGVMFAFATMAVHFVELTVGRQTGSHGLVWPSKTYAIEILAWDLCLGLALVFAAAGIRADDSSRRVRRWLRITGMFCIGGLVGPAVGNMRLQLVGVFGYAILLPVLAWMLSRWFRAEGQRHGDPAP